MNVNDIIPVIERSDDGELRVSSEQIAEGAGVEHRAVLQLIGNSLSDFEAFGRVAFEMRPFETAGGTQTRRIALLNEQQATLLMTYQRNTEQVRRFKMALVRAFYEMAQRITSTPVITGPALMAAALIEAQKTIESATAQVAELTPRAEAWDVMVSAKGDYAVDEAAKILSRDAGTIIGRNRLFALMADMSWVYRSGARGRWHARQEQVDLGRLVERMSAAFLNAKTGEMEVPAPTIRITPKGLDALRKRMKEAVA